MKILFLSAWFPYPANNGSKLRIYNLLRGLARAHSVSLITFGDETESTIPHALAKLCEPVRVIPQKLYNAHSRKAVLGLFSAKPRVLVDRHLPEMEAQLRSELAYGGYDLVIASQWYTAAYLEDLPGIPAIFEEAEMGIFQDKLNQAGDSLAKMRHRLTHWKLQTYYGRLLHRFGATTVVSNSEKKLLMEKVPQYSPVVVIPNGVSLDDYRHLNPEPQPGKLIFTGSFSYSPNYEAMLWFTSKVLPAVRAAVPEVELCITGEAAGRSLPEPVRHLGYLRDIRPEVASSWASLAPLHTGGGTRIKILEAMALRTPVIATSKGAEGLDVQPGVHLLVADTPEAYAEATIRLLKDPGLRRRLVDNAYELVRMKYDWNVIMPHFLDLAEWVSRGHSPSISPEKTYKIRQSPSWPAPLLRSREPVKKELHDR